MMQMHRGSLLFTFISLSWNQNISVPVVTKSEIGEKLQCVLGLLKVPTNIRDSRGKATEKKKKKYTLRGYNILCPESKPIVYDKGLLN